MNLPYAELVEHVGLDGAVIGIVSRAQMRAQKLCHRAVFVVVISDDGCLLVHRRSAGKDIWPGWWDIAVGGVVAVGETYEDAARRELEEEVGISAGSIEFLCDGEYHDDSVHLVGRCFIVRSNGPFLHRDGEVEETRLVTPRQFALIRTEKQFLPDSLALILPHLSSFRDAVVYDGSGISEVSGP